MKIALAQLNPVVGDINGNSKRILSACYKAANENASLLITPELSLWGYPPKDLLLNPVLIKEQWATLERMVAVISSKTPELTLLIGIAESVNDLNFPSLFNSIAMLNKKGWEIIARKQLLPKYDFFD